MSLKVYYVKLAIYVINIIIDAPSVMKLYVNRWLHITNRHYYLAPAQSILTKQI